MHGVACCNHIRCKRKSHAAKTAVNIYMLHANLLNPVERFIVNVIVICVNVLKYGRVPYPDIFRRPIANRTSVKLAADCSPLGPRFFKKNPTG